MDGLAVAASQLVDRVAVAFAPSASALRREERLRPTTIVAVAVASRDLPSARDELADLAGLYPQPLQSRGTFASVMSTGADVIHISGHAEGGSDATFTFLGERISARRIAAATLQGDPLVLLAACETLRAPRSPQRRTLSLGEGFLVAGARSVIGTLAPIADNDAREIFGRIHRHLARGSSAADALRLAQLESMAADRNGAWRSVALLTRTIESGKESS
jgi:CHAT domain-containing protein